MTLFFLFLLGLSIGSFLNVVILRASRRMDSKKIQLGIAFAKTP